MNKISSTLFALSIVLVFLIGMVWQRINLLKNEPVDKSSPNSTVFSTGKLPDNIASKIYPVDEFDHIWGDRDAKIKIIEYLDFECRFCREFHETIKKVSLDYGEDVAIVFRHYPLDDIHPGARKKAESAECVAILKDNNAFISYTDKFLSEVAYDSEFNIDVVKNISESVGVSSGDLDKCLNESQAANIVEGQKQGGVEAGIRGTPQGFIVNDSGGAWLIPEALPEEQIKALIEEALKN